MVLGYITPLFLWPVCGVGPDAGDGGDPVLRPAIRAGKYFVNSEPGGDRQELFRRELDVLLDQLAAVA